MLIFNLRDGSRLCVPADLRRITPYILAEQEDWFEDEIGFVRRWLRPGMSAVDVGASFGVYALAMARAVGARGRVWAFEPSPEPAEHLERSLALNGCGHVVLRREAVSDAPGRVAFRLEANSELGGIAEKPGGMTATVDAVTLDQAFAGIAGEIDFLKIDVEGHEARALRGAAGLLDGRSPLVMFEIRAEERIDLGPLEPLAALGYGFYRLLPGPMLLVPFDPEEPGEPSLLNLFACRDSRARALAAGGRLAGSEEAAWEVPGGEAWFDFASRAPYSAELSARWPAKARAFPGAAAGTYLEGLAAFARSRDERQPASARVAWLNHAYRCIAEALDAADTLARRVSCARVAWELGWRQAALDSLEQAARRVDVEAADALREPFLAPSPRYERRAGAGDAGWLKCAVVETFEKLDRFSSVFGKAESIANLQPILGLPYRSAEMARRWQLARFALGVQASLEPAPELCAETDENLNPAFWSAQASAHSTPGPR